METDKQIYKLVWIAMFMVMGPLFWIMAAFAGVLAEWLWGDSFRSVMVAMGMKELAAIPLWKTAAFLMFIGGFFFRPVPIDRKGN